MTDWLRDLSRLQIGLLGGIIGFSLGLFSGPVLRLILTFFVLVTFGLVSRSIESRFEAHLGFTGIVAVILLLSTLGPIQRSIGQLLGNLFAGVSHLILAIVGILLSLKLHQAAQFSSDEDN
jgi:hypothetical protein